MVCERHIDSATNNYRTLSPKRAWNTLPFANTEYWAMSPIAHQQHVLTDLLWNDRDYTKEIPCIWFWLYLYLPKAASRKPGIQPTLVLDVGERHGWVSRSCPIGSPGESTKHSLEFCARNVFSLTLLISFVKSKVIAQISSQVNARLQPTKCLQMWRNTEVIQPSKKPACVYKHITDLNIDLKHCLCWQIFTI